MYQVLLFKSRRHLCKGSIYHARQTVLYHIFHPTAIRICSTPRPRCVNSQLVSLQPVGILNNLCSICNICLLIYSVPN